MFDLFYDDSQTALKTLMTPNQLQQIIDYATETEEALYEFDMDRLAMQTELPILHQTIEKLIKASADCADGNFRVLMELK